EPASTTSPAGETSSTSEPLTSPQAPCNFEPDPAEENATPTGMPTATPEAEPTQSTQGSENTTTPLTDPNPAALW
ncbi:MAG TPA: hypothetical protein V6D16_15775, partial [Candidatus Obscuribacterales bacterium]